MVDRIRRTRVAPGRVMGNKESVDAIAAILGQPHIEERIRPTLKYSVWPGPVTNVSDGQKHFIPSDHLMMLYKVDPRECLVISPSMDPIKYRKAEALASELKLIPLYPDFYGKYEIPSGN